MTDISIMKSADSETIKKRVKAIYPHIVVSGDIDKPYYSVHWYDIEKEEMYCGFSSYKLEFVRKWLEEEFEVVEADIDNLINCQKEEIERLNKQLVFEIESAYDRGTKVAVKEFAGALIKKAEIVSGGDYGFTYEITEDEIDNLVKEMVGEG